MSTNDLSKEGLCRLIQDNLDFLCQQIEGTVAQQWVGVILLFAIYRILAKVSDPEL